MHTKKLEQLTLNELASIHLSTHDLPIPLADGFIQSTIGNLVTEITQSRGRRYTRIFSPLYGSFALLDQIGSCYFNKKKKELPKTAPGIKKALYHFCEMDYNSDEMKALYGLRNSLVHDGSILYRGRYKSGIWEGPFHHFILGSQSENIVELPAIPWDGKLENLTPDHRTRINQRAFTDLAIKAASEAKLLLSNGDLGFSLTEGEIELYYRYLFHTGRPTKEEPEDDAT